MTATAECFGLPSRGERVRLLRRDDVETRSGDPCTTREVADVLVELQGLALVEQSDRLILSDAIGEPEHGEVEEHRDREEGDDPAGAADEAPTPRTGTRALGRIQVRMRVVMWASIPFRLTLGACQPRFLPPRLSAGPTSPGT